MSRSVKKNYIYNLIYNVFLIIIPIIITPYISRILKADGIGIYQYTYAIVSVFILIANLGTNMYAQKEIAYNYNNIENRSRIALSIFYIRLLMTIVISIAYFIMIFIVNKYQEIFIIEYIFIISNLLNISWFYQGLEDFKKTATRGVITKVFSLIAIFLFVKEKDDLIVYTVINALATLISSIVLWKNIKKDIIIIKVAFKDVLKHIKPILLLFLPVAAIYVYTYIDRIILGILSNEYQVGFYSQSENIVKIAMTIVTSLGAVLLPRIAKLLSDNKKKEIQKQIYKAISFVIFIGVPMVLGLIVTASLFVPWFLGDDYSECIFLIQLLSPLIVIIGLSSVTGQAVLIPLNKQKEYTLSIVAGAIINVIINCLLIPKLGAIGASIGTLAAELLVNIIQQVIVFKLIGIKITYVIKDNYKILFANLLMLLVLLIIKGLFNATILNSAIYIIIGIITYLIVLILLRESKVLEFKKIILKK